MKTEFDKLLGKNYPVSPCANSKCRSCYYYSSKTITCDYYLLTGKRKRGVGESCSAWLPASLSPNPGDGYRAAAEEASLAIPEHQ